MKQPYASFRSTIAASNIWKLPVFGTSFRVLYNSLTTNPQVSINNSGSFYEIAAGIGPYDLPPFNILEFRNPSGSVMELWVAVGEGKIDDARATFSEMISVKDVSDAVSTPAAVTALPLTFLINNAAAVNKGGGKVGIPVTSQPFATSENVTITGTTNYNGAYAVDATSSANEVVITATYAAETFDGVDDSIGLTAPRSVAASTTRKEIILSNNHATLSVWWGDTNTNPATYRGTPIPAGAAFILSCTAQIYLVAPAAAGKTGIVVSLNNLTKT